MLKNKKGITLVALVVTIVVLLVLAGVSINLVLGDNGIISKAKLASNTMQGKSKEELDSLDSLLDNMDSIMDKTKYLGMSTLNFLDTNDAYYTDASIKTLKSWGANTLRLCVSPTYYADESEGIMQFDSTTGSYVVIEEKYNNCMQRLYNAMDALLNNDMYVIVNYHTLYQGKNNHKLDTQKDVAKRFFEDVSTKYKGNKNIIYEINNEDDEEWSAIAQYAKYIIPTIRKNSENSLIIVGTPAYDGRPDDVQTDSTKDDYLGFENLMYACHVYRINSSWQTSQLQKALDKNIPIFVTEWSTADGSVCDEDYANCFVNMLKKNNLSWCNYAWGEVNWNGNQYAVAKRGEWDESLPDSVLNDNGKYVKKLLGSYTNQNNESFPEKIEVKNKMIKRAWDNSDSIWGDGYRNKITTIQFDDKINIPSNAEAVFDMGATIGTNVKAYVVSNSYSSGDEKKYDLHIQANGKIYAPDDCGMLFQGFNYVNNIDLSNFVVKPSTTSMYQMFGSLGNGNNSGSSIVSGNITINLGDDFDTSGVTNMYEMFAYVGTYADKFTINFGAKFNTANVQTMGGMFNNCAKQDYTSVFDFSNFEFSDKLTETIDMFKEWDNLAWRGEKRTILVKDKSAQDFILEQLPTYTTNNVKIK